MKNIVKQIKCVGRAKSTKIFNYKKRIKRKNHIKNLIKKNGIYKKGGFKNFEHILFITIDCARKDHFSAYGYGKKTTPFIEKLKYKSAFFKNAIAPSSWTYPSVASILTGLYPHNHGGVFNPGLRNFEKGDRPKKINDNILTIPEILEYFGYKTYMDTVILPASLSVLGRFQHVKESHLNRAEEIFSRYISWLKKQKEKTFSYLQLGDLHQPIQIPKTSHFIFRNTPNEGKLTDWNYLKKLSSKNQDLNYYRKMWFRLYDTALRNIDKEIEKLFYSLDSMGILKNTLIIITADHGEEMWEHTDLERQNFYDPRNSYGAGHGHHLWEEIINVPLLIYGNNINNGIYENRVSLVDIFPSIMKTINIKGLNNLVLDGENVLERNKNKPILSEDVAFGYEKKVVLNNNYKLYKSKNDNIEWVFDLKKDPQEQNPLSLPDIAKKLSSYLPNFIEKKQEKKKIKLNKDIKKRLEELGYMDR